MSADNARGTWVCCQLGAREHYVVPRALARQGRLSRLITDAWVPKGSLLSALPGDRSKRLRERHHNSLAGVPTTHFTTSLIAHEFLWSLKGTRGWELYSARNHWFQKSAASAIASLPAAAATTVFAHSYAALDIFRAAKVHGWRCVLGQIDPGERHFSVVAASAASAPEYGPAPPPPPAAYLADWRQECALADHIVVNSDWSRQCLSQAGVPGDKMTVVPLAYEGQAAMAAVHEYPDRFTAERPLRLLFVGQVAVAKGIKALLDAMTVLIEAPVELTVVGDRSAEVPQRHLDDPRIHWIGPMSRSAVMDHYRAADVLVFPSLSDGFGMAQVEAQGWRLPIIASRSCGQVVTNGRNGWLLPEVSAQAIAEAVRACVAEPATLARFSRESDARSVTGLDGLGDALQRIEAQG